MRRPAVFISAAFGIGVFTAFHINTGQIMWIILMICAIAVFIWEKFREINERKHNLNGRTCNRYVRMICLFICFAAAGGCCLEYEKINIDKAEKNFGRDLNVEGIVLSADEKDGYYMLTVGGREYNYLVRYYGEIKDVSLYIGSTVNAFGHVQKPAEKRNPACFDYELYLRSCGIGAIIDAKTINIMPGGEIPFLKITVGIRSDLSSRLTRMTNQETKGMIMAILFGDKNGMEENIYEEFRENGTSHVLAVSGLHVGVLYGFFVTLWRGRKGCLFYIVTMIILLMYTILADCSPSVVRAALMIILHSTSGIMHRRYDILSATGITFLIMLSAEPYRLFNTGFQLSFIAMASIGVVLPYMKNFYKGIFLSSAAIQLGMMPYTAFVFNYVSLSSVVANVPVIFIAGILLPIALCLLAGPILPESLFEIAVHILEIGCDVLIGVNRLFYADGLMSLDVVSPPVWLLVLYYGIVFMFMSEAGQLMRLRQMKKKLTACIILIVMIAVCVNCVTYDGFGMAGVTFVDVGQGDCIHIRTRDGKNYLIDGGGSQQYDVGMKTLKPYLLKNGVRHIDAAFVTHLHQDHYGGIRSLAEDGMIDKIGVYEGNRLNEKELESGADLFYLYEGQKVTLGQDVFLEVMAPERKSTEEYEKLMDDESDENSSCLIFKLIYMDVSILVTGDIGAEGESELINRWGNELKCDVLKVPHHGSRLSSSAGFIEASDPSAAVFQVGKNNYGHPAEDVIEAYEQKGINIYRNDRDGAVGIIISESGTAKVIKMVD